MCDKQQVDGHTSQACPRNTASKSSTMSCSDGYHTSQHLQTRAQGTLVVEMCGDAAELAEMRNKIRLLQADAPSNSDDAPPKVPEKNSSEPSFLPEDVDDQSGFPQQSRIRYSLYVLPSCVQLVGVLASCGACLSVGLYARTQATQQEAACLSSMFFGSCKAV